MKFILTLSSVAVVAAASCVPGGKGDLKHWPKEAAKSLNTMIAANAHKGRYACFDMDNTSWHWDVEESLIPYLENLGVLTRDNLDPFLKFIPFKDTATEKESLYSYYNRLCEIDDDVCYPWAAQCFAGLTLKELKHHVDNLMALNTTVPTNYYADDGKLTKLEVNPPVIFRGQVELYNSLMKNGIEVYIITASSEDIVRMIAADPKYGYNMKTENIIGINSLLKNKAGDATFPRKLAAAGTLNSTDLSEYTMVPYMMAPGTWKEGKWASIMQYIDMWKKPILVAGDTPSSDGPMLFHGVDVARGGIHLWVNRKDKYMKQLEGMMKDHAAAQKAEGLEVTADKNWVIVKPEDIL